MKARIPEGWKETTEYSFRFHSYENMHDENKYKERWWVARKNTMAWTRCGGDVNLSIQDIISWSKYRNTSFNELLSHCISHEIIHSILTRDISDEASGMFDNICSGKNTNFKLWFGGMP